MLLATDYGAEALLVNRCEKFCFYQFLAVVVCPCETLRTVWIQLVNFMAQLIASLLDLDRNRPALIFNFHAWKVCVLLFNNHKILVLRVLTTDPQKSLLGLG